MSTNEQKQSNFSIKRKPILSSYSGNLASRRYVKNKLSLYSGNSKDLSSFENGAYLDPYFRDPAKQAHKSAELSCMLYATNRVYQQLLDYLTNMFYWRSVTIPREVRKNANDNKTSYIEQYHKMLEVVEGFNIEIAYPNILLELYKRGQVFLYAFADKGSKTVSIIMLPNDYCASSVLTQYGTQQVLFDFKFFTSLGLNENELNQFLKLFPEEFETLYEMVQRNEISSVVPLDPRFSTCLNMNEIGFPTFLSVFYDIIDYKTYKINELDRNTNGLERLVTQEIDMEKTGLEIPEIEKLHESISGEINGNGTTLITSVGKIDVKQLQKELNQENEALTKAYKTIYDNAGFNYEVFGGDSAESILSSIKRDMNFVWKHVEQIVNFYNLAANNLFKFGSYQLSFRVLPISPYNENEKLELYRANASLGVGVIDLIVASGTKQVDIEATLKLEENLDLVNRLKPLHSSHTQGDSLEVSSTTNKETDDEKDDEGSKNNSGNKDEEKDSKVSDKE